MKKNRAGLAFFSVSWNDQNVVMVIVLDIIFNDWSEW